MDNNGERYQDMGAVVGRRVGRDGSPGQEGSVGRDWSPGGVRSPARGSAAGRGRIGLWGGISLASLGAAAAFGLAACGGAGPSGTGAVGTAGSNTGGTVSRSTASDAKLLDFARCMRAHGLPGFPDPVAGPGGYSFRITISPGSPMNPHSAQFQAANNACKAFSPYEGLTPAQQVGANVKALRYSRCMRSQGISAYPDPNGQGTINVAAGPGIDPTSPRFQQAEHACQGLDTGFNMSTTNFPS